jgi:LmbE family N-acetylglucosaminyl deacetylase
VAEPVSVVVFGAHPDDCDIKAGGSGALWAQRGDRVLFVSLTNGDAGHQSMGGAELARRRRAEAEAAAGVLGVRYHVCDHHDGELEPTLQLRAEVIALIRAARADLVLLPRPWDYHPDHRAAAQVVQDAAYMVTVPNVAAFAPHLARNPVFAYVSDVFTRPCPLRPDVAVDITAVAERKLAALHCHTSQVYEWLPYNGGYLEDVPLGQAARRSWLAGRWGSGDRERAAACREVLARWYGSARAAAAQAAEVFEVCELGRRPDDAELRRLFPLPPEPGP